MAGFGKRELNKAQTRIDILNAVYRLTSIENFRDLKVKTIIEQVDITEMTFFNYFQKKEDILKYMMGVWAVDLQVLQYRTPLSGEMAIRRIFHHTAAYVKTHPRLMVNFIAYLATNEIEPTANEIEAADRFLLHPDCPELYDSRIPSGNELLLQHLAEINPARDHTSTLLHLASCFYGDVLVAHTAGLDIEMLYSNSLDLIFSDMR